MAVISTLVPLFRLFGNVKKTRQQLVKKQQKELYQILMYAYGHSEYYRRVFSEKGITRENLKSTPITKFPTLDKETLMEHFDELVTVSDLKQEDIRHFDTEADGTFTENGGKDLFHGKYHIVHSSGSTGLARYFVYDEKAWAKMLSGITRGALWGMSAGQILKLLAGKPKILYIAATDGRYGGAMAVGNGVGNLGLQQRFLDINTPLQEWIRIVREFQPDIVIGYPSAMKILGELAEQDRVRLHVTRIISCGEPLSKGLRQYLKQVFHAEVVNFYGASESLALGVQYGDDESMALFDDLNYVEVIDGELYITVLYNYAQPLIRYHISDQLQLLERGGEQEALPFTRSNVLLARDEDVLWFQDAEGNRDFLHPLAVEGFCVDGLLDYQFRKTDIDAFEMLVEVSDERKKEAVKRELLKQVKQVIQRKHMGYVRFFLEFTDRIEPDQKTGKKQLIVNHI